MPRRERLDRLLVAQGLAPTRESAQALILAGTVRVDGETAHRAGAPIPETAVVTIDAGRRYVSRGGEKLEGALEDLGIDVVDSVCLDIGASTGGFTDCLLTRGARRVHAVDVGRGQLDWKLRNDPRVSAREGLNAREPFELAEPVDLIVADVSFISLSLAVPPSFRHLKDDGDVIVLVKPQFEAGRESVGKGGLVRDPRVRAACVMSVAAHFAREGVGALAVAPSRLHGREGNREIFLHARRGRTALDADALLAAAERAAA